MLSQQGIFALIQQLGGSGNNIIVNTTFVDVCGSHNAAMMLAQLLYWTPKATLEGGWIAKEKTDWHNELRLSPYQVRQATEELESMGILEYHVRKFGGKPTGHYRLNSDGLVNAFVKFLNIGKSSFFTNESKETSLSENKESSERNVKKVEFLITDTTTEITTEITGKENSGSRRVSKNLFSDSSPTEAPRTRGRPKNSDIEVCPVFTPARDAFVAEFARRVGTPYRFAGGKDGAALKSILTHLKGIAEGKDWEGGLQLFNAIIQGWDKLPKWYHQKFNLAIINSQLNEIIAAISAEIRGVGSNKLTPTELM